MVSLQMLDTQQILKQARREVVACRAREFDILEGQLSQGQGPKCL